MCMVNTVVSVSCPVYEINCIFNRGKIRERVMSSVWKRNSSTNVREQSRHCHLIGIDVIVMAIESFSLTQVWVSNKPVPTSCLSFAMKYCYCEQALAQRNRFETYTSYVGAEGILRFKNGKLTMGIAKSAVLSYSTVQSFFHYQNFFQLWRWRFRLCYIVFNFKFTGIHGVKKLWKVWVSQRQDKINQHRLKLGYPTCINVCKN